MPTEIKLDDHDGNWLTLEAARIKSAATDLMLDHPSRRGLGGSRYRRALVHDKGDRLTINYAGDYPGGVRINQASVNLAPQKQDGEAPKLPKEATVGDLIFIENHIPAVLVGGGPRETPTGVVVDPPAVLREAQTTYSLWICVGRARNLGATAVWRQISLGDEVWGEG